MKTTQGHTKLSLVIILILLSEKKSNKRKHNPNIRKEFSIWLNE
jgi:hypothetical protein